MTVLALVRRVAAVGGVETLGVIAGGLAGLLIVNVLPKDQYAQYTFLLACMTLLLGVTDLGIAHCTLPVVGQRAREVPWVVGACQRVFHWRWALLGAGVLVVAPYLYYTTREHSWGGAAYWMAAALFMGIVLTTLREHYANAVLLILGHVPTLNKIGLKTTAVRLGLVGLVLLLPITAYSVTGIVAATAAAGVVSVLLYRQALAKHDIAETRLDAGDAKRVDAQVLRIARPLVLPAVFYQVQGVVTVLLVSLFGTANMLAEVGAFGRLAMVLMVLDRMTNILLFPAIARAPTGPRLATTMVRVHVLYLLCMALVLASAVWLPQYWILLLGKQYSTMAAYVWIVFLASMLNNAAGMAFRTLTVRGATANQSFSIPLVLAVQALYLWLFGAADLRAVLLFNLATAFANFGYQYLLLGAALPQFRRAAPLQPPPPAAERGG